MFEVEINRGGRTLGFTCSFLSSGESQSDDGYSKKLKLLFIMYS